MISVPCNLNIIITDTCPANCFFCIEHQSLSINDDKEGISDSNIYIKGLEDILKELNPNDFEITITGGEPLISKNLIPTMELCHRYGFRCRTFSTTGYHLMEKPEILKSMIDNGFIHNINISRMSIRDLLNAIIFDKNVNSWNEIRCLVDFFKLHNAEMRLSCNLMKNSVNSMSEILEFVDYTNKNHVDSVLFRELVNNNTSEYISEHQVHIKDIIDTSAFTYIETLHSNYYNVDVYKWKDYIVKHYTETAIKPSAVSTMSYKNGILRIGFTGKMIYQYGKN